MILYLIRFSLAVLIFYSFYRIVLSSESNHVFIRVYLILGLIISLCVPIVAFSGGQPIKYLIGQAEPIILNPTVLEWETVLLNGYYLITVVLIARFMYGIFKIIQIIRKSKQQLFQGGKVILMKKKTAPFSFLHYVFVSEEDFESIEKELMDHELAHVQQWHTLDLFFIEILLVLFWFNPVLIWYKRSMQLNHEFLADQAVIGRTSNIGQYQKILMSYLDKTSKVQFGSGFNFALTKKRFQMMTNRKGVKYYKQALVLPLLLVVIWACSDNEGVSGKEMLKYWRYTANMEEILQTGMMNEADLQEGIVLPIENKQQYDELQEIYSRMNSAQKESVYPLPVYLEPIPSEVSN